MAKLALLLTSAAFVCFAQNPKSTPTNPTAAQPPRTNQQATLTTAEVARRVAPSVVVIQGKTDSGDLLGSGFIVSKDGKIVTNLHVIREMKTATVQLANGETFDSLSVLATDERRDLAVVQIAGFNLSTLELGNSDVVTVGEPLVIVGSPKGLEGTVTAGILSSVRDSGDGFKVLQTDAAVNPGNSGGPLVNNKGQVVGVVSFKLRSAEGLNFAVPINYLRGLLGKLHEAVTLDEMRRSLNAQSTPDHSTSGPSLKETLGWLRDRLVLANVHYGDSLGGQWEVTLQVVPVRFASCTVVFDEIKTDTRHHPDFVTVTTTRYTLPLGLGIRANAEQTLPNVVNPSQPYKVKDIRGYSLGLSSATEAILKETHYDDNSTASELTFWVKLFFSDESMVRRVGEAFSHAATLCQNKEPF